MADGAITYIRVDKLMKVASSQDTWSMFTIPDIYMQNLECAGVEGKNNINMKWNMHFALFLCLEVCN